uniref:Putative secreted peptide n=1 Tax=Anopheles braziliensis TaxID=58242 RepID=A0A2M3ZWR7_9DIPT
MLSSALILCAVLLTSCLTNRDSSDHVKNFADTLKDTSKMFSIWFDASLPFTTIPEQLFSFAIYMCFTVLEL